MASGETMITDTGGASVRNRTHSKFRVVFLGVV